MLIALRAILLALFIAAPIGDRAPEADLTHAGGGPCDGSGPGVHLATGDDSRDGWSRAILSAVEPTQP